MKQFKCTSWYFYVQTGLGCTWLFLHHFFYTVGILLIFYVGCFFLGPPARNKTYQLLYFETNLFFDFPGLLFIFFLLYPLFGVTINQGLLELETPSVILLYDQFQDLTSLFIYPSQPQQLSETQIVNHEIFQYCSLYFLYFLLFLFFSSLTKPLFVFDLAIYNHAIPHRMTFLNKHQVLLFNHSYNETVENQLIRQQPCFLKVVLSIISMIYLHFWFSQYLAHKRYQAFCLFCFFDKLRCPDYFEYCS